MAPKPIKKTADKKTDAEKKKIKQANKAKANPTRAAEKLEKNNERRYRRGQAERPNENKEKDEDE